MAPSLRSTDQFSRRITQPGCRVGWVTKLLEGLSVVYISMSMTKALAPHWRQNSGSGTAMSSCWELAMFPWSPVVVLVTALPIPIPTTRTPAKTATVRVLN